MPHDDLIMGLLRTLPPGTERIETHISTVLLTRDRAYKIKKPVDLGFLDYSTAERRLHFCHEEVRLNRRLAPDTYLGVAPLCAGEHGAVHIGDLDATPADAAGYAVVMRRLPADRLLVQRLRDGAIDRALVDRLAALLVDFHAGCATGEGVDEYGAPEEIARQVEDNVASLEAQAGEPLRIAGPKTLALLRRTLEDALRTLGPRMAERVARGRVREGHGDLHAGNLCVLEDTIVAYDCIEFDPRFRCRDVAAEIAFLAMDLDANGFPAFGTDLVQSYAQRAGDADMVALVPFHKLHLAVVRAKVSGLRAEQATGSADREDARREAMRYAQLAAGYALPPALVLMCGLPGSGKSSVATAIARALRAEHHEADQVRKRMAGLNPQDRSGAERGIYSAEFTERTYTDLLDMARAGIAHGRSVVLDATMPSRALRAPFVEWAEQAPLPWVLVEVTCAEDVVRQRLELRVERGTATSDADWDVYVQARARFEPPEEAEHAVRVDGAGGPQEATAAALECMSRDFPARE